MNQIVNVERRKKIEALDKELFAIGENFSLPLFHHFADGTYTRELHIPANTVFTGKMHVFSCINIIAKGRVLVYSDEGDYELEGPCTFKSGPGVRKAGVALDDIIWLTVHAWDGPPDPALVEAHLTVPYEQSLLLTEQA